MDIFYLSVDNSFPDTMYLAIFRSSRIDITISTIPSYLSKAEKVCLYYSKVERHLLSMHRGLIKRFGVNLDMRAYEKIAKVDVQDTWVTPGIFDMHSHLGVD